MWGPSSWMDTGHAQTAVKMKVITLGKANVVRMMRLGIFYDMYTFQASGGDENKCGRCDKLKEHHHNKKRDGTISKSEWCYDFLLDFHHGKLQPGWTPAWAGLLNR